MELFSYCCVGFLSVYVLFTTALVLLSEAHFKTRLLCIQHCTAVGTLSFHCALWEVVRRTLPQGVMYVRMFVHTALTLPE